MAPEAESENVMVFAPDFRWSDFYDIKKCQTMANGRKWLFYELIRG